MRATVAISVAWSEHERPNLPVTVELGHGGFGNGGHPTTRLVVEELIGRIAGGERVLDVGAGSGVLGLVALGLGAARWSPSTTSRAWWRLRRGTPR